MRCDGLCCGRGRTGGTGAAGRYKQGQQSAAGRNAGKLLRLSSLGEGAIDAVEPAVLRVQQRLLEPLETSKRSPIVHLLAQLVDQHDRTVTSVEPKGE